MESTTPVGVNDMNGGTPTGYRGSHGKRGKGTATVSIHVRRLAQLFNSLDPSPFWDRDLDRAAAEFIEDEFRDKRTARRWHLRVLVLEGDGSPVDVQAAIETYYGRLAISAQAALREHLGMGQLALLGGIAIFLLSLAARSVLGGLFGVLPLPLDEGLIVLAWLALWRPSEALIYGWVPYYRRRRLYERLAQIRVSVDVSPAHEGLHQSASVLNPPDVSPPAPAGSRAPSLVPPQRLPRP